jgi:hypothetical protein
VISAVIAAGWWGSGLMRRHVGCGVHFGAREGEGLIEAALFAAAGSWPVKIDGGRLEERRRLGLEGSMRCSGDR